jgi:hypothetical protein
MEHATHKRFLLTVCSFDSYKTVDIFILIFVVAELVRHQPTEAAATAADAQTSFTGPE